MATNWTKKTPNVPYKDSSTKEWRIVAELPPGQAGTEIPGTDVEFHETVALQNAQDNFYEFYGVDISKLADADGALPIASESFEVVTKNGVKQKSIPSRPGAPALYLVRYKGGDPAGLPKFARQSKGAYFDQNLETLDDFAAIFDSYNDFAKMMEILAKQLEIYDKQLKEDNPDGANYSGPAALGYGSYDLLTEAKSVRNFYLQIFDLFKRNNVSEKQPFEVGFTKNLVTDEALLDQGMSQHKIVYIASFEENGNGKLFNGLEYFFGGNSRWQQHAGGPKTLPGKEPFILERTVYFIRNLGSIINILLDGFGADSIDDVNVGAGCKLPPLAGEEDPMPLLVFMEQFVQPKPMLLFSLQGDPLKVFDKQAKRKSKLMTKPEKDAIEDAITGEEILQFAVSNRTEQTNEMVGDYVFDSLPRSPNDIKEIRSIEDAYATILNRIDMPTLIEELLACLGLTFSIQDLIDIACDKLLKKVFGDGDSLQNLIDFMESDDPVLGTAFSAAGIPGSSGIDAGGSIHQLTQDLKEYLVTKTEQSGGTGSPAADEFFQSEMINAFNGDVKATKRFICEVIILGPFIGLLALIALIKRLRRKEDPKEPKIPPFKKCEPGFSLIDDWAILARIKQWLIDKAYEKAEELLEELILIPLRELLENIFAYCRSEDEYDYGAMDPDDVSYDEGAFDDYDQSPEFMSGFLGDLFPSLSPSELCALYKGEATQDLLEFVLSYFQNSAPEGSRLAKVNTTQKVAAFYKDLGTKTDLSFCDELEDEPEDSSRFLIDLCDDDAGFKEKMLARALLQRGLSVEEIEEQLSQAGEMNKDVAGALLDLLTAADRASEIKIDMSEEMKESIKPNVDKAVNAMFTSVENNFITDVSVIVSLLTSNKLNLFKSLGIEMVNSLKPDSDNRGLFLSIEGDGTHPYHAFQLPVQRPVLLPELVGVEEGVPPFTLGLTPGGENSEKYEIRYRFMPTGKSSPFYSALFQTKQTMEIVDTVKTEIVRGPYEINSGVSLDIPTANNYVTNALTTLGVEWKSGRNAESQLFALIVNQELHNQSNGYQRDWYKDLRDILINEDGGRARKNLFGLIFRDMLHQVAKRIDSLINEAANDAAFKELDFLKEDADIYNLQQIKDEVSENFSDDISKIAGPKETSAEFENPEDAPLLFDYLIDWPTAGATKALLKLFSIEMIIKSIVSVLLTKPDKLISSDLFTTYSKDILEKRILDSVTDLLTSGVTKESIDLDSLGKIEGTEDLKTTISKLVKDTSDSLSDIIGDKLVYYRIDEDMATKPPIVSYPSPHAMCEPRSSIMNDNKTRTMYEMRSSKVKNGPTNNSPGGAFNLKYIPFTNPRFFEFNYEIINNLIQSDPDIGNTWGWKGDAPKQIISGWVLEKCVRYKFQDEDRMFDLFKVLYSAQGSLKDDPLLYGAFSTFIKSLPMEYIGRGVTMREILGSKREWMELGYHDFYKLWERFNSDWDKYTAIADSGEGYLGMLFEYIQIGYRLSYVFPENATSGRNWWKTPMAGTNDFWDRFNELQMAYPANRPQANRRFEAYEFMKMKKHHYMKECTRVVGPTPIAGQMFVPPNEGDVFVLPFVTVGVQPPWPSINTIEKVAAYFSFITSGSGFGVGEYINSNDTTTQMDEDGWKAIQETHIYKMLFKGAFSIDKMLSLVAIRNSVAFDEHLKSIDSACLGNGKLFDLTEESIKQLIITAHDTKQTSDLYELASKSKKRTNDFKANIRKQMGLGSSGECVSKFDLISSYNDAVVKEGE
jgi:hypothetical protein